MVLDNLIEYSTLIQLVVINIAAVFVHKLRNFSHSLSWKQKNFNLEKFRKPSFVGLGLGLNINQERHIEPEERSKRQTSEKGPMSG